MLFPVSCAIKDSSTVLTIGSKVAVLSSSLGTSVLVSSFGTSSFDSSLGVSAAGVSVGFSSVDMLGRRWLSSCCFVLLATVSCVGKVSVVVEEAGSAGSAGLLAPLFSSPQQLFIIYWRFFDGPTARGRGGGSTPTFTLTN